ncbi:1-acyl-sn-glycerol-3-phosphate acyltransferase alpha-like [Amblyomma americanum]
MRAGKVVGPWGLGAGLTVLVFAVLVRKSQKFRFFFRMTTYYVLVSAVCSLASVPAIFRPFNPANMLPISYILKRLAWTVGLKAVLQHEERIPRDKRFILVSNHQSSLDVFGLLYVWNELHPCVPVMKSELVYTGPLALTCYLAGSIFIDRRDREQSHQALNNRLEDVRNGKTSFVVFPEGTRNPEPTMLSFKKGAFHMAVNSQAPVLPLVFSHYKSFFCSKERKFNNGILTLTVLPEISTEGLTPADVADLTARVRNLMQAELDQQAAQQQLSTSADAQPAAPGGVAALAISGSTICNRRCPRRRRTRVSRARHSV